MELLAVNSSNLKAIGYEKKTQTMRIQFQEGATYEYYGVPAKLHRELMQSESKGSFFQERIINRFAFQKVNLREDGNTMKNNQQKHTEARSKAAAQPAAQQAVEAPKPATTPTAQPTKQEITLLKLTVALREQRKIEVKPDMLKQDGKFILLVVGPAWPTIRIGNSGGITVVELRSYTNAFDAAIKGDELLAKQNARDQKKTPAPAPAATPAPAKPESTTAKKAKAHATVEKQLEAATA